MLRVFEKMTQERFDYQHYEHLGSKVHSIAETHEAIELCPSQTLSVEHANNRAVFRNPDIEVAVHSRVVQYNDAIIESCGPQT